MTSNTRRTLHSALSALAVLCLASACTDRVAAVATVTLEAPREMKASAGVGRAPSYALSSDGAEAMVWVTAPGGGTQGRLDITRGARVTEFSDSLGPIEAHDESPPKIAFGRDSSTLFVLYVVARLEEGRRFPASALRFISSRDGGATWSAPITITDDSEFGSHNFHALHVAADGAVYVAWLDGRHGVSNVYLARSTDGGATWNANQRVHTGEACPCCRTAIASDANGNVYVAWRTVLEGNVRDIVVARSGDRGTTWSAPERVHADNWVFAGCPHAGPSMQLDDEGRLHIAWWTGLEGKAGVYYANSDDGSRSWSEPVAMGVADFSRPASVQLAAAADGKVLVAWSDATIPVPQVVMRASPDRGDSFGDRVELSTPGTHAAFPVISVRDPGFAVLWSEQSTDAAKREATLREAHGNAGAAMGLHEVGETKVILRRGTIRK